MPVAEHTDMHKLVGHHVFVRHQSANTRLLIYRPFLPSLKIFQIARGGEDWTKYNHPRLN
jgi:hypothetical protein